MGGSASQASSSSGTEPHSSASPRVGGTQQHPYSLRDPRRVSEGHFPHVSPCAGRGRCALSLEPSVAMCNPLNAPCPWPGAGLSATTSSLPTKPNTPKTPGTHHLGYSQLGQSFCPGRIQGLKRPGKGRFSKGCSRLVPEAHSALALLPCLAGQHLLMTAKVNEGDEPKCSPLPLLSPHFESFGTLGRDGPWQSCEHRAEASSAHPGMQNGAEGALSLPPQFLVQPLALPPTHTHTASGFSAAGSGAIKRW